MPVVAMGIGFNTPSDGQVINGVAHFVRPTAPTVRNDGSALQDNDRWYDLSTGKNWIRRGIYWVSSEEYTSHAGPSSYTSSVMNPTKQNSLFIERITLSAIYTAPIGVDSSPTNYYVWTWKVQKENGIDIIYVLDGRTTEIKPLTSRWVAYSIPINSAFFFSLPLSYLYCDRSQVGSPSAFSDSSWSSTIYFRLIYS